MDELTRRRVFQDADKGFHGEERTGADEGVRRVRCEEGKMRGGEGSRRRGLEGGVGSRRIRA